MGEQKIFYCVKCREKKLSGNYIVTELKGGRGRKRALLAKCPDCGTKMYKIIGGTK